MKYWKWWRLLILTSLDTTVVVLSYWIAFALRLESFWPKNHEVIMLRGLPIYIAACSVMFFIGGFYREVWKYATISSAIMVGQWIFIADCVAYLFISVFLDGTSFPRSVPIIFWFISTMTIVATRFLWRLYASLHLMRPSNSERELCLIYGAGSAGDLLARHAAVNPRFPYQVIGFIDDDLVKRGRMIHGLPIVGSGDKIKSIVESYQVKTVILAMPSASGYTVRHAVERCYEAKIRPLIMPDMATSLRDEVFQLRTVDIKDLLKRSPRCLDETRVKEMIQARTILVTGAGGSIGSEICRQVILHKPRRLVILDSSEYNLYQILTELEDAGLLTKTEVTPVLGSVTDRPLIERTVETHRPWLVLHAAAYKHVPMIECNALEGIINNIAGTRVVAEAALKFGVKKFVLISTDKAVRPTSVMGATKRCCELLIQAMHQAHDGACSFSAVRFGNVLGSSGSVIPRFLKQIQAGGPVTVTHPDVTRYFMLIPEAVGLVLRTAAISKGCEIFVLNMGEPVRIYDMAKQLIRLSGKEPDQDIEISFTGLRPGEKLFEELTIESAEHIELDEDIYIAVPNTINAHDILGSLSELVCKALNLETEQALDMLWKMANTDFAQKKKPDLNPVIVHPKSIDLNGRYLFEAY